MKLSTTNGPLYHFYGNGDDLHATLAHVKEAGFRYVDISFWSRYDKPESRYFSTDNAVLAEEYRRELETLELTPIGSHEPWNNFLGHETMKEAFLRKDALAIDLAGRIGIPSMTIHHGMHDSKLMSRDEFMELNAAAMKELIPMAEKYGVRLLIENLPWKGRMEGVHLSTADDLLELLDRIDHPLFGVCWDTGHANLCGLEQYSELKKLGSKLENLHIHDNYGMKRTPNADLHLFPFWGNVNFDAVMTALLEIGYKGTFNFEADNPVRRSNTIPFMKDGEEVKLLGQMPAWMRVEVEKMQYMIGKYILESYDCFEE